jgi:hypothetical protein
MDNKIRAALLTLLIAAPLAASAQAGTQGGNAWRPYVQQGNNGWTPPGGSVGELISAVGGCGITDMRAFESVIATKPTPAQFRALYSCVHLVLPGDITTKEMRSDNSRYHADLDVHGRIVGGVFQ